MPQRDSREYYTEDDVIGEITKVVAGPGRGAQVAVAREWGVPRQELNDVLRGRRGPTPEVLRQLGFEKVVVYRKKAGPR